MEPNTSITDKVQAKLKDGSIRMRSRTSFVLSALFLGVLAVLISVCGLVALSFVFYSAYQSGELFLLGFGGTGILTFLLLFPWGLSVVVLLLLALFQYVLSRITDVYKFPLLTFFTVLIAVFTLIGLLIAPLHRLVWEEAERRETPYVKEWYEDIFSSHERHGVFRGIVTATSTGRIVIEYSDADYDLDDREHVIVLPEGMSEYMFMLGDEVFVAGELEDGEIEAYGVHSFK